MMMRALLGAALLALAGCAHQDGYSFLRKEYERKELAVTVVVHPSLEDLRAKAPASAQSQDQDLMGWSILRLAGCETHVVDPAKMWLPEWIGHEIAHCIWGRWHR